MIEKVLILHDLCGIANGGRRIKQSLLFGNGEVVAVRNVLLPDVHIVGKVPSAVFDIPCEGRAVPRCSRYDVHGSCG